MASSSPSASTSASPVALLLAVLCLLVCACMGAGHHRGMARHKKLQVFFHDRLNFTDVLIAEWKAGDITLNAAPFGSIFCLHEPMTATAERESLSLGSVQGTATTTTYDGHTYLCALTITFNSTATGAAECPSDLKGVHGTINILGLVSTVKPEPHAIAGGTGDFMFAQGVSTIVPIDLKTFNQTFRIDLDVYWPY